MGVYRGLGEPAGEIGFARWMIFALPLVLVMLPLAWAVLVAGLGREAGRWFDDGSMPKGRFSRFMVSASKLISVATDIPITPSRLNTALKEALARRP